MIVVCRGSALAAATGGDPTIGKNAILELMEAVTRDFDHNKIISSASLRCFSRPPG